jgi:hypothetical protein
VHHADGSRRDDAPLVICQDAAYHKLLHVRMRVREAGGNPDTDRICYTCKAVKPVAAFPVKPTAMFEQQFRAIWYCRTCTNARHRQRRARRKAAA